MVGARRGGRGAIMQPRSDGQEGLRVMDRRASSGGMNRGKKESVPNSVNLSSAMMNSSHKLVLS